MKTIDRMVKLNNLYEELYESTDLCGIGNGGVHIHVLSELIKLFPNRETEKVVLHGGREQWQVMYKGVKFFCLSNDLQDEKE
jgi:hypothetical protein